MQDDEYKMAMDAAERVRLQPELREQVQREVFDFLGVTLDAQGALRDARRGHPVYPARDFYPSPRPRPRAVVVEAPGIAINMLLFAAGAPGVRYSN